MRRIDLACWLATCWLAACKTSQPSTSVSEVPPARTPASSAPSSEAAASAPDAQPAPEHHPHAAGHHHGTQGYHMDFSEVERFARHFESPDRDAWQKPSEVTKLLDLRPGQVVADIGAGTGYFVPYLSKVVAKTGRVLALDVEPNMVEYMRRRGAKDGWTNVDARVVAPDDPNLPPASVDRILIVDTWHHIDDRSSYAAKLSNALKPSGTVMVVDFTLESDMGPPADHRLAPEQVMKELEAGGLRATVVERETLPKQYVVRAAKR